MVLKILVLALVYTSAVASQCVQVIRMQSFSIVTPAAPPIQTSAAMPSASQPALTSTPSSVPSLFNTVPPRINTPMMPSAPAPPMNTSPIPSMPSQLMSSSSSPSSPPTNAPTPTSPSRSCGCSKAEITQTRIVPFPLLRRYVVTTTNIIRIPGTAIEHTIRPPQKTVIKEFGTIFSMMTPQASCDPKASCSKCPGQSDLGDGALDIMPAHNCCAGPIIA